MEDDFKLYTVKELHSGMEKHRDNVYLSKMTKKWNGHLFSSRQLVKGKRAVDIKKVFSALLTELSKAFDFFATWSYFAENLMLMDLVFLN